MALLRGVQAAAHDPVNDGLDRPSTTKLNRRILLKHVRLPQVLCAPQQCPSLVESMDVVDDERVS